jgi:hypothetical protein
MLIMVEEDALTFWDTLAITEAAVVKQEVLMEMVKMVKVHFSQQHQHQHLVDMLIVGQGRAETVRTIAQDQPQMVL